MIFEINQLYKHMTKQQWFKKKSSPELKRLTLMHEVFIKDNFGKKPLLP